MKLRISAILCILALLLSACAGPTEAPTQTADPSDPAQETSEIPPEGTEPPPETDSRIFRGSVTPGGFRVETDDSAYRAYTPPPERYTKPETELPRDLEPQSGLRAIYPYVSANLYTANAEGYSWENGHKYGFVDDAGRLLTSGSYTSIRSMTVYHDEQEKSEYLPLWIMSRAGDVEIHREESDGQVYTYPEGKVYQGVAAKDGSFVLPCAYLSIQVMGDRYLCSRSWDQPDFEIYDLQGKLLLTDDRLFDHPCDWWSLDYSEDLYLARYSYEEQPDECRFLDQEGREVLGPYVSAAPFREGLACVSQDGISFGYIDKTGAWVIPPRYAGGGLFQNGLTVAFDVQGRQILLDRTGAELLSFDEGSLSNGPFGVSLRIFSGDFGEDRSDFYNREGELLFSGTGSWEWLDEALFCRQDGEGVTLHSLRPEVKDLELPGVSFLYRSAALVEGVPVRGYRGVSYESGARIFLPEDLSQILELGADGAPGGIEDSVWSEDLSTGAAYWLFHDGTAWQIYDEQGKRLGEAQGNLPRLLDGRVYEITDLACTYRDLDGNLLFSYPLMAED